MRAFCLLSTFICAFFFGFGLPGNHWNEGWEILLGFLTLVFGLASVAETPC